MAQFNLHKITPNSWIANTNGAPVAYINKLNDEYTFMTLESTLKFPSMAAIKTHLGGKVSEQMVEASTGLNSEALEIINGFPTRHANITVETSGDRPVYLRGKTQHVAGYWCIRFSKRWVPSFCPLLRTVEQYQSSGPFKDRLEMMSNLTTLNRQVT